MSRARVAIGLVCLALGGCSAEASWTTRLTERLTGTALGATNPWQQETQRAFELANRAHSNNHKTLGEKWSRVADRYLTAALIHERTGAMRARTRRLEQEERQLTEQLARLETDALQQRRQARSHARRGYVESATDQAYLEAADYEARRFRRRNQDTARLRQARGALRNRAELWLQGAEELAPQTAHALQALRDAGVRCHARSRALEGLACMDEVAWKARRAFMLARATRNDLPASAAALHDVCKKAGVVVRWENEAFTAVVEGDASLERIARAIRNASGPIQLQGKRDDVRQTRKRLQSSGIAPTRFAGPGADSSDHVHVRFLLYPSGPQQEDGQDR